MTALRPAELTLNGNTGGADADPRTVSTPSTAIDGAHSDYLTGFDFEAATGGCPEWLPGHA